MSNKTFQQYGELAETDLSYQVKSGRYRVHGENESELILDVLKKLELKPSDHLLEIGCGSGNILIPLSFFASKTTGIDHPSVVKQLRNRFTDERMHLIGANFLEYKIDNEDFYQKILINSVLGALSNEEEALVFIEKAANLLVPGGRMLIGDIANTDKKRRFLETDFGLAFGKDWEAKVALLDGANEENEAASILQKDDEMFAMTDGFILKLLKTFRRTGWEAYSLPQPVDLPFGHTREDILICRLPA